MVARLGDEQRIEAVRTLAGGVAHEFNNILMSILGNAQTMGLRMESKDPLAGYLREIEASCVRAAGLTRRMLTFSQLQLRDVRLVQVNRVLAGVIKCLRPTLAERTEVGVELEEGLPQVMADATLLEQVLLNLGTNARDAVAGAGKIRFQSRQKELREGHGRVHPRLRPGRYVEVLVEDTGIGMTPEVMARIFDPFFTTKEPGKGTGLGLSIAYAVAKNHGGFILAESRPGRGSCFRLYLPVPEGAAKGSPDVRDPRHREG